MFTPLVLMCSMYTMECASYGGPIFETEQECYSGMANVGLPYLVQKFPDLLVVDTKCVHWDYDRTKVNT